MQRTTTFSRGAIVLVPFTFSDSDRFKLMPALVLSSEAFQASRADIVVAALTSRVRRPLLAGDYLIEDWRGAGLIRPTAATGILRTVKSFMVSRILGTLDGEELQRYDQILLSSIGLGQS